MRRAGGARRPDLDLDRLHEADVEVLQGVLTGTAEPFDLEDMRVSGDASGLVGSADLRMCLLDSVDLSGTRVQPFGLLDCVLRRTDLSNAVLQEVTARRVDVLDCGGVGLRLSLRLAADVRITDCRLDWSTIRIGEAKGTVEFRDCSFAEATIGGDLSNVTFADCRFASTEFAATSAAGCDLRGSDLGGSRGLTTLRGARITADQAVTIAPRLAMESGFQVTG